MQPINLFEYEARARTKLEESVLSYYAGGARDEITLADNRDAFNRWSLHYRVLTVDAPVLGTRERDVRNRFTLPEGLAIRNLAAAGYDDLPEANGSALAAYAASQFDPGLSWTDVEWLCDIASVPVLVKGVVRPDDAVRAAEHGASGVVVSNHGGRQLDTAPATIDVLEPIVEAVAGRLEILVDGGVRRGTDVIKAIALGAKAVLLGRPILWGLAVDGEAGAHDVLRLMRDELDEAMALCGCRSIDDVTRDLVRRDRPALSET